MKLRNGLYKVTFSTPLGSGAGVVVLTDGAILGGDYAMYYVGQYSADSGQFRADVDVKPHTVVPMGISVLGTTRAHISLSGTYSEDKASAEGSSPEAPGLKFAAKFERLAG